MRTGDCCDGAACRLWLTVCVCIAAQMWELFVGQRPYGNMSQQKVVEEVVLRGLRPSFPPGTPLGYTQLACSCWHATAGQRPSFQEIVGRLQVGLLGAGATSGLTNV
jgi:hypothetical protein